MEIPFESFRNAAVERVVENAETPKRKLSARNSLKKSTHRLFFSIYVLRLDVLHPGQLVSRHRNM